MVENAGGIIVGIRPVPERGIVVLRNDVDERHREIGCVGELSAASYSENMNEKWKEGVTESATRISRHSRVDHHS